MEKTEKQQISSSTTRSLSKTGVELQRSLDFEKTLFEEENSDDELLELRSSIKELDKKLQKKKAEAETKKHLRAELGKKEKELKSYSKKDKKESYEKERELSKASRELYEDEPSTSRTQQENVTNIEQYLLQKFICLGRIQLVLGILCCIMSVIAIIVTYEVMLQERASYFDYDALALLFSIVFIGSALFISTGCLTFCMKNPEQVRRMYLKPVFVACSYVNAGLFGPAVFLGGGFHAYFVFLNLPSYTIIPIFIAVLGLAETIASASAIYWNYCMCETRIHPL